MDKLDLVAGWQSRFNVGRYKRKDHRADLRAEQRHICNISGAVFGDQIRIFVGLQMQLVTAR